MSRARALLTLGAAGLLCGGCVAAAIPIVAGGSMAGKRILSDEAESKAPAAVTTAPASAPTASNVPKPVVAASPTPRAAADGSREGAVPLTTPAARAAIAQLQQSAAAASARSAEAEAASLQAYQTLWSYVEGQVAARRNGGAPRSVVLANGASLDAPAFEPCGGKPLAILFDIDEQAPDSDPDARYRRWIGDGSDAVVAVPGAVEGVEALQREGVQAIFTSARRPAGAASAAGLLARLGFGDMVPGKTLILRGGEPPVSGDQMRRTVAASYCVVAIVGDTLSDFSDAFDAGDAAHRPAAATQTMVAPLWGAGWFLLPSPVRSLASPTAAPTTQSPKE